MNEKLPIYQEIIGQVFPELREGQASILGSGWHSDAVEVNGWVFKFPKNEEANYEDGF